MTEPHSVDPAGANSASAGQLTPPTTGVPDVDHALQSLDRLADREVIDHAPIFDDVHGVLREVLSAAGREDSSA